MMRSLRSLLLTAMAVAALGAVWASAAYAAEFTAPGAGAGTTNLTTEKDGTAKNSHHVFDVPGNGTITCQASLTGSQAGESAAVITMSATYNECSFLGQSASVNMGNCDYTFSASGNATVDCSSGEITFEAAGCQVHIPAQALTGGLTYTNVSNDITAAASVTGIHGVATGGCPAPGTFTTGEYTTGNTIVTGGAQEIKIDP